MELQHYATLGNSGLKVPKIIVGCMGFGDKSFQPWVIDDDEKVGKLLKYAYDKGLRSLDTANVYSFGESERMVGKFLQQYKINRSTVTIMTKAWAWVRNDPNLDESNPMNGVNRHGLSRKHLIDAVDASVSRLGTYIDLFQIHRMDYETPKEEIMETLHDLVKSGKVRYIGASSMPAVEFAQLQFIAEKNGWTKFISMQNLHNLVYREEEREMIPFCESTGVAVMPWSPLAMGVLARPVGEIQTTSRSVELEMIRDLGGSEANKTIIRRVQEVADKKGVKMAQVATAWCLAKGEFPIIGLSSEQRVDDAIAALNVGLTADEIKYLEEPYEPRQIVGFETPYVDSLQKHIKYNIQ